LVVDCNLEIRKVREESTKDTKDTKEKRRNDFTFVVFVPFVAHWDFACDLWSEVIDYDPTDSWILEIAS